MATNTTEPSGRGCLEHASESRLGNLDPLLMTYYYGTFAVLMVLNLFGNTMVLRTILRHHCMRTPANSLLCSLATSDLLFGLLYPVYNVSHIEIDSIRETLGQWSVCRVMMLEVLALEVCASYGLVAVTLSRQIMVAYPLRYQEYLTSRVCYGVIVTLWVVSHIICVSVYATEPQPAGYCNVCRFELLYPPTHLAVFATLQFVIPISVMVAANVRMALTARALHRRTQHGVGPERGSYRRSWRVKLHQKSVAGVSLLLGCFALAWVPQIAYLFLVIVARREESRYEYFSATVRIFLYLNSAVNVFIYAGRMADFRQHVRRDLGHWVICRRVRVAPDSHPTDQARAYRRTRKISIVEA